MSTRHLPGPKTSALAQNTQADSTVQANQKQLPPTSLEEALKDWGISDKLLDAIADVEVQRIKEWETSNFGLLSLIKDGILTFDFRARIPVAKALTILTSLWAFINIIFPQLPALVGAFKAAIQGVLMQ